MKIVDMPHQRFIIFLGKDGIAHRPRQSLMLHTLKTPARNVFYCAGVVLAAWPPLDFEK
ncbi:hypothetical protein GME_01052 [Halomonas sp. TD01]|nr:hypothetical protein GME_01052 [Halomonas sp. TD01]